MPVTLDPEHYRALWGGIVGLAFFLALALWHLRRAKRPSPADRGHPAPSLLARAAQASGLPPTLAYLVFALALGLLVLGLVGAVTIVGATILQTLTQGAAAASLGAGALIAALLGAPFILWRSLVAQRTVNIAQESHITDLIAKAVEQLGAEKTVDRIGRPVTVWTGERKEHVHDIPDTSTFQLPPRSREISRANTVFQWTDEEGDFHEDDATAITFESWPTEVTRIEWRDTPFHLADDEVIASPGAWEVFSETVPNLEVRIGAILALERLARQNLDVHVQIMEILTAYVRANAPASSAPALPVPPDYDDSAPAKWEKAIKEWSKSHKAALAKVRPRDDIQKAISVIGRRTSAQRITEAHWQNTDTPKLFVFDNPPSYPITTKGIYDATLHDIWNKQHKIWRENAKDYRGYRLGLQKTNLCGMNFVDLNFSGAVFNGAQMQGALLIRCKLNLSVFTGAQLQNALLEDAEMHGAGLPDAHLQGVTLHRTQLHSAYLVRGRLEMADMFDVNMREAWLSDSHLQCANLHYARLEGAKLDGTHMQWSRLSRTRLYGTDLYGARLLNASLWSIEMDEATAIKSAALDGASMRKLDFVHRPATLEAFSPYFSTLFADASVLFPDEHPRPAHWPKWELGHVDKWRSQRRIEVMSMKPRKLSAVLS